MTMTSYRFQLLNQLYLYIFNQYRTYIMKMYSVLRNIQRYDFISEIEILVKTFAYV